MVTAWFVKNGNAVNEETMADATTEWCSWPSEETIVLMETVCSAPVARRATVTTTSFPCTVVVSRELTLFDYQNRLGRSNVNLLNARIGNSR